MLDFLKLLTLAILAVLLTGCASIDSVECRTTTMNLNISEAENRGILLNLARAMDSSRTTNRWADEARLGDGCYPTILDPHPSIFLRPTPAIVPAVCYTDNHDADENLASAIVPKPMTSLGFQTPY